MIEDPSAIGVVVTLKVAPENASAFEAIMRALCADVARDEPGTLFYHLCRVDDQPGVYRMIEAYAGDAGRETHRRGAALKVHGPNFVPLLIEKPSFDDRFAVLS